MTREHLVTIAESLAESLELGSTRFSYAYYRVLCQPFVKGLSEHRDNFNIDWRERFIAHSYEHYRDVTYVSDEKESTVDEAKGC